MTVVQSFHSKEIINPSGPNIKYWTKHLCLLFPIRVVTSITFQLHVIPDHVIGGDLFYSISQAAGAFKDIRDFIREKEDNRISVYMMVHFKSSG